MVLQHREGDDEEGENEGEPREDRYKLLELSMNWLVGLTGNHTMKLMGKLKGEDILVLKNNDATHNFIATEVVERLNLRIQATRTFEVSLEDGYKMSGRTICPEVAVEMQGIELWQSFHDFDIGIAHYEV